MRALSPILALLFAVLAGCGTRYIPNTTVADSSENREVIEYVERYRHAVERRDIRELLGMASPAFYDDNGTPTGSDDVDFDILREKLSRWSEQLTDCRYEIRYHDVEFRPDGRVWVKFRYTASFRVFDADGEERWVRRVGDNRLVLARDGSEGDFSIVSGL